MGWSPVEGTKLERKNKTLQQATKTRTKIITGKRKGFLITPRQVKKEQNGATFDLAGTQWGFGRGVFKFGRRCSC